MSMVVAFMLSVFLKYTREFSIGAGGPGPG